MRSFGRKSSFDTIIVIMLGAVLSRAVVGASPLLPTVVAGAVLVVVHRLLAMVTARAPRLERLIKGEPSVLYRDGSLDHAAMLRSGISRGDLEEAVRSRAHHPAAQIASITMETSGKLTVGTAGPAGSPPDRTTRSPARDALEPSPRGHTTACRRRARAPGSPRLR